METELKYENSNLRVENAKLKFETLFNERPSTIRSFAFHGGLRIFYLVIGSVGFIGSLIYLGTMVSMYGLNQRLYNALEENTNEIIAKHVADAVMPVHIALSIALLALSICFLIMARLCRKIVKRNMYIMDLETTWMELKDK